METKIPQELIAKDKELYGWYLENYVNKTGRRVRYGTAGFRDEAKLLRHVAWRAGIFASYMAKLNKGFVIGVQITASHNPSKDNGVKFIGANGLMMKTELEKYADALANTDDLEEAIRTLEKGFTELSAGKNIDWNDKGYVLIGNDTRESSPELVALLGESIKLCGSEYIHFDNVTTPQLHYMILVFNGKYRQDLPKFDYNPKDLLQQYYDFFGNSILKAFDLLAEMGLRDKNFKKKVVIDCSNGVGGIHQDHMTKEYFNKIFDVTNINWNETKLLNEGCGSEFVQKEKKCPSNLQEHLAQNVPQDYNLDDMSFLSYDGDADRTVFYRVERGNPAADLFEGDKLGALYALFCQRTLQKIIELQGKVTKAVTIAEDFSKWSIGAALTAYANGSAQKYYKDDLKVNLMIEPTGVKYLHVAAEHFDVGIYFESNGHGTVVFHPEKLVALEEAIAAVEKAQGSDDEEKKNLHTLHQWLKLFYYFLIEANQGVGDAISNFLQIETALAALQMNAAGWKAIYKDLENAHSKVVVKNRFAIKVNYDQSKVTTPTDIQPKIEEICAKYEMGRAFIRPSGTEDICRIYAEATKIEDVRSIEKEIKDFILAHKEVN